MHFQIIVFGKTAEPFFIESQKHYTKRIQPFATVEWKELKEEKIVSNTSADRIKEAEAKRFFEVYNPKNFLIACDVQGKSFSSPAFSQYLQKVQQTHSSITIVIGGALGLCETILSKAHLRWSLSAATFPHDLFRTMMLEQLYRSCMIAANRDYHKE